MLSLRIARCKVANTSLSNYKVVMPASLRVRVRGWDSRREVSWSWLRENVERMPMALLVKPAIRERVPTSFIDSLDESAKQTIRREVCVRSLSCFPPLGRTM